MAALACRSLDAGIDDLLRAMRLYHGRLWDVLVTWWLVVVAVWAWCAVAF